MENKDNFESVELNPTSHFVEASALHYEQEILPAIAAINEDQNSLQDLVHNAEKIINEQFAPPISTYTYKKVSVQLDQVMLAMLVYAEGCGGERGKRYVATAIVACSKQKYVAKALAALGTTWLTHFLFLLKTSKSHRKQTNKTPSEFATPTLDETTIHLQEGISNRKNSFKENVMARDGYTCVVTRIPDWSHPTAAKGVFKVRLVGAHILRRAIGNFDEKHNSKSFKSAAIAFDILRNFTLLPVETLDELSDKLDDPSNGMLLQNDAHDAFDNYYWYLTRIEDHVYHLNIIEDGCLQTRPENDLVFFKDRSQAPLAPVNLPDPLYIAIHAAVAQVLHTSGAGKFFDELLDDYKDKDGNPPAVQSWSELEMLKREVSLGELLVTSS